MSERTPVAPYMAVGLSTIVHGVAARRHIQRNLDIIEDAIHAAVSIIGINMPVKLIALAEGALTGFTDEIFDIPHVTAARELFIDIPGEESERLAELARLYETYIVVQCKARWPEVMPDRFFNTLFVISPQGEIVHTAAKNHLWCRERSCTPHDVYDRWVELFGDGIEAFYPVLRTDDIGNLGTICCSDGEYPEAVRALAFGGAEVVYRPSEAVPMTQAGEPGGTWLLQNRAHAHFNSLYIVAPERRARLRAPAHGAPVRHRRRQLAHRRLPGRRDRPHRLGREQLRGRHRRHRGAAPVPRHEPELELDEGPAHRAVPAHVRAAHPPAEPLARAGSAAARGRRRGLPRQHRAAGRARRVHAAGARLPGLPLPAAEPDPADADWANVKQLWADE